MRPNLYNVKHCLNIHKAFNTHLILFQVKGVTDCISEAEKSGLLCRQDPLGYDRHGRKYWFLARRIIVYVIKYTFNQL